jgi:hypothetical protein
MIAPNSAGTKVFAASRHMRKRSGTAAPLPILRRSFPRYANADPGGPFFAKVLRRLAQVWAWTDISDLFWCKLQVGQSPLASGIALNIPYPS